MFKSIQGKTAAVLLIVVWCCLLHNNICAVPFGTVAPPVWGVRIEAYAPKGERVASAKHLQQDKIGCAGQAKSPHIAAATKNKAKAESPDEQFIRCLDGARYAWSRDFGSVHQSATYEIRGRTVHLKWEEVGGGPGSSIRREQFRITGRTFFRIDHDSCALLFSGAQHCSCRYTIKADAIETAMFLGGQERPSFGSSLGICLAPDRIPRETH